MGKIIEKGRLVLRTVLGECEFEGRSYGLSRGTIDSLPVVKSEKTGRLYHFEWEELVQKAIAGGIDIEPDPDTHTPKSPAEPES